MFNLKFLANPEKPYADDRIDSAVHILRGKRVAAELSLLKLGLRLWCVFQDKQGTTRVVADVVGFLVYRKSLASTVRVNYFAI